MDGDAILRLRGFGIGFGDKTVLEHIHLAVPSRGAFVITGSGGAGKSTLVRTLAGHNDAQPALRTWGRVDYLGRPLSQCVTRPSLVGQNARLLMSSVAENLAVGLPDRERLTHLEQRILLGAALDRYGLAELGRVIEASVVDLPPGLQRRLAIVRSVLSDPALLMLDEPTAGLDDDEREPLLALLRAETAHRAVLVITHNRQDALRLGGQTALFASGQLQAVEETEEFFLRPSSEIVRHFVATGTCYLPPESFHSTTAPKAEPDTWRPPPPEATTAYPRSLHWVLPGQLAGLPRPGLLDELEDDLAGLAVLGVTLLVNLEETPTVPAAALDGIGIASLHFPIADMGAPAPSATLALCQTISAHLATGHRVAVHCRAGLGRTGTVLAAYLISLGSEALVALESVRRLQPRFVQSQPQLEFLQAFAEFLTERRAGGLTTRPLIERSLSKCP